MMETETPTSQTVIPAEPRMTRDGIFKQAFALYRSNLAENTFVSSAALGPLNMHYLKKTDEQTTLLLEMLLFWSFLPVSALVCSLASQNTVPKYSNIYKLAMRAAERWNVQPTSESLASING